MLIAVEEKYVGTVEVGIAVLETDSWQISFLYFF
jgi:hypothetical protein